MNFKNITSLVQRKSFITIYLTNSSEFYRERKPYQNFILHIEALKYYIPILQKLFVTIMFIKSTKFCNERKPY